MPKMPAISGAIFDIDGTLLNDYVDGVGLHERARLAAAHKVGKRLSIAQLQSLTMDQAAEAWVTAKEHTMLAATWRTLHMVGLVSSEDIDHDNTLLKELAQTKDELFVEILQQYGSAMPGAYSFVSSLVGKHGLGSKLAISSTACQRDIDAFLKMANFTDYFPGNNIISLECVSRPKPHPESFDLAFKTLGLPESKRSNVIALEDHPRGIASAKHAGLFTCAIATSHTREHLSSLETAPDLIADSFKELEKLLDLRTQR